MSIITQSTKMYSRPDKVKHIKDSMDVVNLLQLSDDTKGSINDIRSKILYIANVSSFDLRDLKNDILELNNKTLAGREYSYPGENFFSIEYNTLKKVHSTIMGQNPQAFLQLLLTNINTLLQEHLPSSFELTKIPNISEEVASINANGTNFNEQFNKISNSLGHSGEILFLQECIKQNLCIENIIDFSSNQMQNKKGLDGDNLFIYCDYNNIKSLAETKQKFLVNESTLDVNIDINKRKAFCLSGGISSGLIQLGYIQQHIENGGTISALSGSSIGGVIGSLVAFAGNDPEKISNLVSNLKKQFGDAKFEDGGDISTNDKMIIKDIFIKAGRIVGIDEHTIFSDSIIPITINASREYGWFGLLGEQEVMLGGEHKVLDSVRAGVNFKSPLGDPLYGKTKVNGMELYDHAANEEGNPIHHLENLGIPHNKMVVIDIGYSSTENKHLDKVKYLFSSAIKRDIYAKTLVEGNGGKVINANAEPSDNNEGFLFHSEAINNLLKIGAQNYVNT